MVGDKTNNIEELHRAVVSASNRYLRMVSYYRAAALSPQ